ncbi:MAG: LuxR C-terminal-related transcriptional regulator [Opitutales bacterium]
MPPPKPTLKPSPDEAESAGGATPRQQRVVIAKHDRMFAEALGDICLQVFPQASVQILGTGGEVLASLQAQPADVLLIGLRFPDMDGIELLQRICQLRLATHILVVSGILDEPLLPILHTARVDAIIDSQTEPVSVVKTALQMATAGQVYVSPSLRASLVERHPIHQMLQELTVSELRVLRVIGNGSDNQEAAQLLHLSESTVQTHRRNIMQKFKVSTSAKLVREAVRLGVVQINSAGYSGQAPLAPILARKSKQARPAVNGSAA